MNNQKHLFSFESNITYLNGAYMSPQLKNVEEIGIKALKQKSNPHQVTPTDFFTEVKKLKSLFAKLIHTEDVNCAIIPSVSYGMAVVAKNVPLTPKKNKIIVAGEQFPSNVYAWKALEKEGKAQLHTVNPPAGRNAADWNQALLDAIDEQTAMITLGHIHWADGTRFDLQKIREKSRSVGAWMVIDGTQSVGALPFSVAELQPEALICAGYKWLMGAYGLGMAYFSPELQKGKPIEENWINRYESEDFANLTRYADEYEPGAARFDMGEKSNFILVPMLATAIGQLLDWGVDAIQEYSKSISLATIDQLRKEGFSIHQNEHLAFHLWGVRFDDPLQMQRTAGLLKEENVFVSFRGNAIRISVHVYNEQADLDRLVALLVKAKN